MATYTLIRDPDTLTITSALTQGASARVTFTVPHDESTVSGNALEAVKQYALYLLYGLLEQARVISDPTGAASYRASKSAALQAYQSLTGIPSGTLATLVAMLKASLQDSAQAFTAVADSDYIRHINAALADMNRRAGRMLSTSPIRGSITLVEGAYVYTPPADCRAIIAPLWGKSAYYDYQPWESGYPAKLPVAMIRLIDGHKKLVLSRAVTAGEISQHGDTYEFDYIPNATIETIPESSHDLLILRAQAEAMRELGFRAMTKPVALRTGTGSQQGAPMQVYQALMAEFEKRIA